MKFTWSKRKYNTKDLTNKPQSILTTFTALTDLNNLYGLKHNLQ